MTGHSLRQSRGKAASAKQIHDTGNGRLCQPDGWDIYGGYSKAKKQKLEAQYECVKGIKSNLFHGVTVHITGYTNPSSDKLRRLVIEHGGRYEHYQQKSSITHLVASSLADCKITGLKNIHVVVPDWICDSVRANCLQSVASYKLFKERNNDIGHLLAVGQNSETFLCGTISPESNVRVQDDDANSGNGIEMGTGKTRADNKKTIREAQICDGRLLGGGDGCLEITTSIESSPSHRHNLIDSSSSSGSTSLTKADASVRPGKSKFLQEFYGHSRLHHISSWRNDVRAYVEKLQLDTLTVFPGRDRLRKIHGGRVCRSEDASLPVQRNDTGRRHTVMHVDMDCFFVSVSLLRRPELRGKPVAVAHAHGKERLWHPLNASNHSSEKSPCGKCFKDGMESSDVHQNMTETFNLGDGDARPGIEVLASDHCLGTVCKRGSGFSGGESFHSMAEIASCSYEAREVGVRNGMMMGHARQLCPDLIVIPYDFNQYRAVSKLFYETVASYTHDIEAVSCDEMLIDCADVLSDTGVDPLKFASRLCEDVAERTHCTASAGIGSNVLLARLATRRAKPDGQFHVLPEDASNFIKDHAVSDLPGVGFSTCQKLNRLNVRTCGDLQAFTLNALQQELGPKHGQSLYRYCRGEDSRPVCSRRSRKSVSAAVNYGIRFGNDLEAASFLEDLADELSSRLLAASSRVLSLSLRLMVRKTDAPTETAKFFGHGVCDNISKSVMLPLATDDAGVIRKEAVTLLAMIKPIATDIRGVALHAQRLEQPMHAQIDRGEGEGGNQSMLNFAVGRRPNSTQNTTGLSASFPPIKLESMPSPWKCGMSTNGSLPAGHNSLCPPPLPSIPQLKVGLHCRELFSELLPLPFQVEKELESVSSGFSNESSDIRNPALSARCHEMTAVCPDLSTCSEVCINADVLRVNGVTNNSVPSTGNGSCCHGNQSYEGLVGHSVMACNEDKTGSAKQDYRVPDYSSCHPMDLSFSEIDPEVFRELPADIQQQLMREMSVSGTRRHVAANGSEFPLPVGGTCDTKASLERPITKKPKRGRGRPRGRGRGKEGVSSKLPQGGSSGCDGRGDLSLLQMTLNFPACRRKVEVVHLCVSGPVRMTVPGASRLHKMPASSSSKSRAPMSHHDTVTSPTSTVNWHVDDADPRLVAALRTAPSMQRVRALLAEWLDSAVEPNTVDMDGMCSYLSNLVLEKNLEQVDLVLKFLHRRIILHHRPNWEAALWHIVAHVQELVHSVHGSRLKTEFPT